MGKSVNFFWFRRDLRFHDNAGLYHALKSDLPVIPLFIFDTDILDKLEDKDDARVSFLHSQISEMDKKLQDWGSRLLVKYGKPKDIFHDLFSEYDVNALYLNRDYEPYAKERDSSIKEVCEAQGIDFESFKDHIIFEKHEVQKNEGGVYTVFTPYKRKWYKTHERELGTDKNNLMKSPFLKNYPSEDYSSNFFSLDSSKIPSLKDMGFEPSSVEIPDSTVSQKVIKQYDKKRNFPAADGTSRLGIHFRFGTISIREKARKSYKLNKTYLNELIWRDFYSQILDAFPHVVDEPFREKYSLIEWRNNEEEFEKWCQGQTGYPIVDAGMRELNTTGYMHNRV
ncbi:MAG: deoxyribodipyrimidine photo-lyase, partial [Bacteroidetes bacterium]|nr:deoxyribodipyrimidine photo-lyase [Bacteroidota bacterium]